VQPLQVVVVGPVALVELTLEAKRGVRNLQRDQEVY
jgi:hypothetical protein